VRQKIVEGLRVFGTLFFHQEKVSIIMVQYRLPRDAHGVSVNSRDVRCQLSSQLITMITETLALTEI
jgi:hypothetical protein